MTRRGDSFPYKRAPDRSDADMKQLLRQSEQRVREFLERYKCHATSEHIDAETKGRKAAGGAGARARERARPGREAARV